MTNKELPYKGTTAFIEAITLLEQFIPSGTENIFQAEQDVIISIVKEDDIGSMYHIRRLEELGWSIKYIDNIGYWACYI